MTPGISALAGQPGRLLSWLEQTPAARSRRVFDVTTSGAKGDGVADDRPPIQAVVDAAGLAGGGVVYFPPGAYRLVGTLAVAHDNLVLAGAGMGLTVLRQAAGSNFACLVAGKAGGNAPVTNIHVRDMTFDGDRATKSANFVNCFFQYVRGGSITGCEARGSQDIGFGLGNGAAEGPTTVDVVVHACWAHHNRGNGFDCANSQRIAFSENLSERNGQPAHGAAGYFCGHGITSDIRYVGNIARAVYGAGFHCAAHTIGPDASVVGRIIYIGNVSLDNLVARGFGGEAFLINQTGSGSAEGPFIFSGNAGAGGAAGHAAIETGGAVTGIVETGNYFGRY